MPSLAPTTFRPSRALVRRFGRLFPSLAILALPCAASGQANLTHTEDAAPIPQGVLRFRMTTGWTRFDERFTGTGRRSLGDDLSTDSLGPRQLPALNAVEQGLQSLTNDNRTRLTFGRLAASSGARIVTTPFVLEYGVTRRLSVGVLIPIVQTRQAVHITVNSDSTGNVAFVPATARGNAAQANAAVFAAFKGAADSLTKLITQCPANPLASGCAAVNANVPDANAARLQAQTFADAVRKALGTVDTTALVAPRTNSPLALAIDAQRNAINTQLRKYLGANAGATSGVFTSANNFSYIDLQGRNGTPGLLQTPLGGGLDSIYTVNRLQTGDISVGASLLVFDGFRHDTLPTRGLQTRLMVGGSFRFATSLIDTTHKLVGYTIGDGAGVEVRSAMDLIKNNLGATIAARFVKSLPRTVIAPLLGDPEATYPIPLFGNVTRTAGAVAALDITPRYLPNQYFSIDGHYGLEHTGSATYERGTSGTTCAGCNLITGGTFVTNSRLAQRIGVGVRYSTLDAYQQGRTGFPVEVSFTHLETITGDDGTAKLFRDQIQMRLYLRVLGGK
ncbi:MAG: hypothetical protein ABJE47_14845 [bacterium]